MNIKNINFSLLENEIKIFKKCLIKQYQLNQSILINYLLLATRIKSVSFFMGLDTFFEEKSKKFGSLISYPCSITSKHIFENFVFKFACTTTYGSTSLESNPAADLFP